MVVCISASIKFKEKIEEVAEVLKELDIPYILPVMNLPRELETSNMTPKLVADHFAMIDKSESVLVVNPTGYFGTSVKIEIGYARGVGKKIYFLEKTNQPELDCLADDFISINELYKLKQ